MCIIVAKPAGVARPTEDVLKTCWNNNSDGAGFMYRDPRTGKVIIKKGYMHYKEFIKAIEDSNLTDEDAIVYHFRITSSGGTSPENTHPFPISRNMDDLKLLKLSCGVGMAHNGVLGSGKGTHSDTQLYITEVLSEPTVLKGILSGNKVITKLVEADITGSKFAILDKSSLLLLGSGWIKGSETDEPSLYYSNSSYKARTYVYTKPVNYYGGYGSYEGYEDFYDRSAYTKGTLSSKPKKSITDSEGNGIIYTLDIHLSADDVASVKAVRELALDNDPKVFEYVTYDATFDGWVYYIAEDKPHYVNMAKMSKDLI